MTPEEACSFLSDLINTSVVILNSPETIERFCASNSFHTAQKSFTAHGIHNLINHLNGRNIVIYRDVLMMHMALVSVRDMPVIIGPYCTEELRDASVELLKRRFSIRNLSSKDFLSYRSRYKHCSNEDIIRNCHVLLKYTGGLKAETVDRFQDELPRRPEEWQYTRQNYEILVTERYKAETEMMECISVGDAAQAIRKYRYLHDNVRFMMSIGSAVNTGPASAAVVRTTIRVPMMNAGLPPVLIDQITAESSHNINKCRNREEVANENERLIRVACEAIRRFRTGKYSMPVYSAVYEIERHYHSEIRVEEMAEHLGLSTAYFIRLFKKETSMTPNAYLVKYRLKTAAGLLHHSNFTVSQISSEVGFQDPNYFTKCFKKEYGVTPVQYRITTAGKMNGSQTK